MRIKVKNIILKESIITEDLTTQKEMEMLAEDVFILYMRELINNKIILSKYGTYPSSWVFNKIEKGKYNTLKDFITTYAVDFSFIKSMDARGAFKATNYTTGIIRIKYDIDIVKQKLMELDTNQSMDEQVKDLFYALRVSGVLSTILHELQHTYDYYRSKGKAIYNKKSNKFYDNPDNQSTDGYLNMKHEVMARITQTFQDIRPRDYSDLNSYIEAFTHKFVGWYQMKENHKKYIYKIASKRYHELDDEKKNLEKKKMDFDKKLSKMSI